MGLSSHPGFGLRVAKQLKTCSASRRARCPRFAQASSPPRRAYRAQVALKQRLDKTTQKFPVVISKRPHPIPSRTRKLSSSEPMVLHGKPCGRVGRCRDLFKSGLGPPRRPCFAKADQGLRFFVAQNWVARGARRTRASCPRKLSCRPSSGYNP